MYQTSRQIEPRWMKLHSKRFDDATMLVGACEYSSIGETRLKELVRSGLVVGFRDTKRRDWTVDRESLDAYRNDQAVENRQDDEEIRKRLGIG